MKKFLFALALGALLVLALATTVTADNGPHGGFNGSTDACASCHRVHSARSADGMLLVADNIYELCTSCHDGTGAFTNVVDGFYDDGTCGRTGGADDPGKAAFPGGQGDACAGLFGGGFEYTRMLTDFGNAGNSTVPGLAENSTNAVGERNNSATSWARWNGYDTNSTAPVARAVTSTHTVDGLGLSNGVGTVWGSGNFQASAVSPFGAGTITLECTSCHDPHGNAGRWQGVTNNQAPYPSYRLLRYTPSGSNGFEVAGEVGTTTTGTGIYWMTSSVYTYTVTTGSAISSAFVGVPVIPSVNGVMVPDTSAYWYTVNNNINLDRTLDAYRTRYSSTPGAVNEPYVAIFAGQGDYGGRYWAYKRPALTSLSITASTRYACWNGTTFTANQADCTGGTGGTAFNNQPPHDVLGFWCSTCHDRYLAPGGDSRTRDTTDPGYHYRHRAAASGDIAGTGAYTCVDCHNAHGTSATASSSLASSASYATGSVLLKADNRAICVRCHAGAINFFNITTSPGAPMVIPVAAPGP